MPTTFRPCRPDRLLLLSPDVREWFPPGRLAHHVSDLVDALDLSALHALYEGDGRRNAPCEPSMLVKVPMPHRPPVSGGTSASDTRMRGLRRSGRWGRASADACSR